MEEIIASPEPSKTKDWVQVHPLYRQTLKDLEKTAALPEPLYSLYISQTKTLKDIEKTDAVPEPSKPKDRIFFLMD